VVPIATWPSASAYRRRAWLCRPTQDDRSAPTWCRRGGRGDRMRRGM